MEPLNVNLPHIPPEELADGRIVRINDGNDSNHQRELVIKTAKKYKDYFFNTAIPLDIEEFGAPVVLTVNPALLTDKTFIKVGKQHSCNMPNNLMFVRVRVNCWNIETVVNPAIEYYTGKQIPVVLTFMAYYKQSIPEYHKQNYVWKKRTLNSYYVLHQDVIESIMREYRSNPYVYSCGIKGEYSCKFCGNCIREYYNTKERLRNEQCRGRVENI